MNLSGWKNVVNLNPKLFQMPRQSFIWKWSKCIDQSYSIEYFANIV